MNKLLSRYFQENFFIIPIRKNEKRPLYRKWNEYPLSYNETKQYLKHKYNIGIVAKDLWILDFDNRPFKPEHYIPLLRNFKTWVCLSPRGYHLYYRNGYPDNLKPDTIRHGDMYALLPPSKIDGHSYWWLDDLKGEIKNDSVKDILIRDSRFSRSLRSEKMKTCEECPE